MNDLYWINGQTPEQVTEAVLDEMESGRDYDPRDYTEFVEVTPRVVPNYDWAEVVSYFEESAHQLGVVECLWDTHRMFIMPDERTIIVRCRPDQVDNMWEDLGMYMDTLDD